MKNFVLIVFLLMSAVRSFGADLRLIDAVKKSDAKTVRSLIALHADVNASEADRKSVV